MDNSEILGFFGRHLVGLCVTYETDGGEQKDSPGRFAAYAGTLIIIRNRVHFLTAGHILREVDDALESERVNIQSAVLADTFGSRRVSNMPIPIDLEHAPRFYIDNADSGLDFGVMAIHPNHVRLLAANEMVALGEENWIHQSSLSLDGHFMLGLPAEFTSDHLTASGAGLVSPTIFRVQRLASTPDENVTRYPRFVGQIDRELPLDDLAGMSGGPIFGVKFGTPMRYWIVALQSSWNRKQRRVFGCPISVLASLLTEWTDELSSEFRSESEDSDLS
jgi:hypothetical protein